MSCRQSRALRPSMTTKTMPVEKNPFEEADRQDIPFLIRGWVPEVCTVGHGAPPFQGDGR